MKKNSLNCVAFVFARGGSKGVLRKNMQMLGGTPLIGHSILTAKLCSSIKRVVVSTDDDEIADTARHYGADVPFMRPFELAKDDSSEYETWKHAIKSYEQKYKEKIDIFVSLPPTSPLRSVSDVEICISEYMKNEADFVITVTESSRSPYFNMVKEDNLGFSILVNPPLEGQRYIRRQDVPRVYDMTTVAYVSSSDFILNSGSIFSGRVKSVVIPDDRAIDIDTKLDLEIAEFLYNNKVLAS
jgi:N,N'-diacetyl-8-epilegionaminate cytidylyltransferase